MTEERKNLLNTYLRANVSSILLTGSMTDTLPSTIHIAADCSIKDLNGHYEGTDFLPPAWYQELQDKKYHVIVIHRLSSIDKKEQRKFIELLKYRKVGVFDLPSSCVIIMTSEKVDSSVIEEEIYSLAAHI